MKICMVTTSFPSAGEDYSGIFILRLCRALASLGMKIDVVAPMAHDGESYEQRDGCCVFRFSYFFPKKWQKIAYGPGGIPVNLRRNRWLYLQVPFFMIAFTIKSYRRAAGADLVHAHWIYSGLIAWIIKVTRGIPFIVTVRGEDALRSRKGSLAKSISLWILKKADYVTTVNEELKEWLVAQHFPPERILFIRNGIDLNAGQRAPLPPSPCRLLFVGSLIPRKGVRCLIDALSVVVRSEREIRLILVGDGAEYPLLRKHAEASGLENHVEFVGSRKPEEISAIMGQADCLVLPSFWEGTPNVVLEAMAAGLPVIASDLPGIREVVTDGINGFLVKVEDVKDLAEKLTQMIQNRSLREKMGERARQSIIEMDIGWVRVAERYAVLYRKVCAESQESST